MMHTASLIQGTMLNTSPHTSGPGCVISNGCTNTTVIELDKYIKIHYTMNSFEWFITGCLVGFVWKPFWACLKKIWEEIKLAKKEW